MAEAFGKFWSVYPEPVERDAAFRAFARLIRSGEADADRIASSARRYAQSREVERGFAMKPANWLRRGSWRELPAAGTEAEADAAPQPADPDALARLWVDAVKAGKSYAASAIKLPVARRMLELSLVTEIDLRKCGVAF